ncbi:MAG: hypothetical protein Q8P07_03405 [bacterium]|nr:hypothetical protein [bacterium]
MTPYTLRFIPEDEVKLFEKIRAAILRMPDLDLGRDENDSEIILCCHILARAVAKVFSLRYEDGYFSERTPYSHSWVLTPTGNIIDLYPVGMLGGPLFVESVYSWLSPGKKLYRKNPEVVKKDAERASFQRGVELVVRELEKI